LLYDASNSAEAEALYRQAAKSFAKLNAEFSAIPEYRDNLAKAWRNLGQLCENAKREDEAEEWYEKEIAVRESLAADFADVTEYRQVLASAYHNRGIRLNHQNKPEGAKAAYRRSIALREPFAEKNSRDRRDMAASMVNLGNLFSDFNAYEESLVWYGKAVELLEPLTSAEPNNALAREYLRNAHWSRAGALVDLCRYPEALRDWERALALNVDPSSVFSLRLRRAWTLAHVERTAEAVAEASELAKAKDVDDGDRYDFARIYALASAAAAKNPGADAPRLAEQYADRAIDLLSKAVAKGFKDVERIKKDSDFKAVREREDFKKLLVVPPKPD